MEDATAKSVCLDVDAQPATPIRVEAYTCNNEFREGYNERWGYDEATGIVSSLLYSSDTSCMMAC